LKKGDLDGAIAEYREAIRVKPGLAEAYNNLGKALQLKGERDAALEEYRKACELDPKTFTPADCERLFNELKK
jgi:Flp pilus assembly protein TadD